MENIEIYFESIRQVYNQILEWRKERENRPEPLWRRVVDFFTNISLGIFVLSLIPIIPGLVVFLGSRFNWVIFNFQLNQANIWTYVLAWLISIAVSVFFIILSFGLDTSTKPTSNQDNLNPPQTLSSEQLTFIFVYQAYKELKIFFVSHVDQHIEKALDSLGELQRNPSRINLDPDFDGVYRHASPEEMRMRVERELYAERRSIRYFGYRNETRSSLSNQINITREFLKTFEKYSWFHLDDSTKARLQALISFQRKTLVRLRKREDLPAVLSVLENLSRFFYAFLPEHQTNMSAEDLNILQSEGIKCLDKFVEDVGKLIDYPPQQRQQTIKRPAENLSPWQKIQLLYYNNAFFSFAVWLLILLAITSGFVYVASLKITSLDVNIMVSTVIATSVTGAAALAAIGTKAKKSKQKINEKNGQELNNSVETDHHEEDE